MNRSTYKALSFLSALMGVSYLHAAPAPPPSASAGIVERQVARQFNLQNLAPDSDIPLLEVDIPKQVLNIPKGLSVYVENIYVQKNFPLFDHQIAEITSQYTNREITGEQLTELCVQIQQLYAKSGYITAWVYPPIQKVDSNTLKIVIVEGTLDKIVIKGNTSYKTRYIERYFDGLRGQPINYNQLMKALLLVNDNSDLSVQGLLTKGQTPGGGDLILNVQDGRPLQLSVGYNNWGSTVTSYNQLSSSFNMGNLATSGDNLSMMTSCGVPFVFYYLNPTYTIPLNGSGANINLSYAYSWSLTQGEWADYDMVSWTEIASATYNQPIARTRKFQLGFNVGFNFSQYKNLEFNQTTSYDRLRVLTIGGTVDYTDSLKGRNVLTSAMNIGIPDIMGGMSVDDPLCSRPGGGGRYWILTLNGQRVQPLLTDCMFVITAAGQGTFNKIPLSVQYFLGGMGTVRGYYSAVAVGDVGYCANFEFYMPPPFLKNRTFKPMKRKWKEIMQILAFIDHGGIYTVDAVEDEIPAAYLTALGAGLRFYGPHNFSLSFDAGFPVMNQYKDYNSVFYIRLNMDFL